MGARARDRRRPATRQSAAPASADLTPGRSVSQARGGRSIDATRMKLGGRDAARMRSRMPEGRASATARVGIARIGVKVGALDGAFWCWSGIARSSGLSGCWHGFGASSVSFRHGRMMGGAATVRPSLLHIGTAACARVGTSRLTTRAASTRTPRRNRPSRARRAENRLEARGDAGGIGRKRSGSLVLRRGFTIVPAVTTRGPRR